MQHAKQGSGDHTEKKTIPASHSASQVAACADQPRYSTAKAQQMDPERFWPHSPGVAQEPNIVGVVTSWDMRQLHVYYISFYVYIYSKDTPNPLISDHIPHQNGYKMGHPIRSDTPCSERSAKLQCTSVRCFEATA